MNKNNLIDISEKVIKLRDKIDSFKREEKKLKETFKEPLVIAYRNSNIDDFSSHRHQQKLIEITSIPTDIVEQMKKDMLSKVISKHEELDSELSSMCHKLEEIKG